MKRIMKITVDPVMLSALIVLSVVSLFVLFSASGENQSLVVRQSIRITLGFAILFLVARIRTETLMRWSPYLYLVGLILLLLVLAVGNVGKGAQRWLDLGLFRFQPAEILKLGVPMMVAWVMTRRGLPARVSDLLIAAAVVLVPTALVILQPDLGTAILIAASGLMVIFLAGMRWRYITVLVIALAAVAPILWSLLHDYQRQRILTLFDPWSDPLGAGYHTIQSMIAIGSGGGFGKGWLNGSQSQLEFIPERNTDFIFAVFGEEFGLLGILLLLILYLIIIGRGLFISFYARTTYARLVTGALALTFFFYLFVNIGMVTGILPVVGVPLPLISYGGTSMVTLMAGFGIMMSVYSHKRLMP